MIVGSLLLILVAVVLLVLGLMSGSSALLTGSIAASLLAAVALVVGARQDTAVREAPDGSAWDGDPTERSPEYAAAGARSARAGQRGGGYTSGDYGDYGDYPQAPADPPTVMLPTQPSYDADPYTRPEHDEPISAAAGQAGDEAADEHDDEDPPDEPAPQTVSAGDAARVARLTTDVLVIDGRPRYHLPGCVHLLGRESEPLPVNEAVELGFTPCSLCEPDSALLTDSHRS